MRGGLLLVGTAVGAASLALLLRRLRRRAGTPLAFHRRAPTNSSAGHRYRSTLTAPRLLPAEEGIPNACRPRW